MQLGNNKIDPDPLTEHGLLDFPHVSATLSKRRQPAKHIGLRKSCFKTRIETKSISLCLKTLLRRKHWTVERNDCDGQFSPKENIFLKGIRGRSLISLVHSNPRVESMNE